MVDKTRERLEELDDDNTEEKVCLLCCSLAWCVCVCGGHEFVALTLAFCSQVLQVSQNDYIEKIDSMHTELLQAWNQNQRVKALKIVIQVRVIPHEHHGRRWR